MIMEFKRNEKKKFSKTAFLGLIDSINVHLLFQLQVTYSEKGTKITSQTHIQKFEILHFSDKISKITMIQKFFCLEKFIMSI